MPITNPDAPLEDSGNSQSNPWDFAHLNSVMRYGDEHIISSHGFCCTYAIDKNGNVKWTLNMGLHPDFSSHITDHTASVAGTNRKRFQVGSETTFCYQHDMRIEECCNQQHHHAPYPQQRQCSFSKGQLPRLVSCSDSISLQRLSSLEHRLWDAEEVVYDVSGGTYQLLGNDHVLLGCGATQNRRTRRERRSFHESKVWLQSPDDVLTGLTVCMDGQADLHTECSHVQGGRRRQGASEGVCELEWGNQSAVTESVFCQ